MRQSHPSGQFFLGLETYRPNQLLSPTLFVRRCDDRIVSISQPHVRPIVRGKTDKSVEFGAKLGLSLFGKYLTHQTILQ